MIDVLFFGVFTGPPVFSYLARGVWLIVNESPGGALERTSMAPRCTSASTIARDAAHFHAGMVVRAASKLEGGDGVRL